MRQLDATVTPCLIALLTLALCGPAHPGEGLAADRGPAAPFAVSIQVDAGDVGSEWEPIWRFFGADEPNYASMTHGRKLLGELGALRPKQVWAFQFEDQPYFAGFRSLATNGIDKPVLNVFRMFSMMSGRRLAVESDHAAELEEILRAGVRDEPDVGALATLGDGKLCVLAWHYHDDDVPGPPADVTLELIDLPVASADARLRHFRIDETHSNAFTEWKRLGSPQQPTPEQYARLEKTGQLAELSGERALRIEQARAKLRFELPRRGVSLVVVEWGERERGD